MKPNPEAVVTESNIRGEVIDLTLDQASTPHLMSIATNLYSDAQMAVLREIATNALDAIVEAGKSDPVRVTLPSTLKPVLEISDTGIGLDDSDLRDIYSKYGASTKRDSNDVVGMLGLGCKSPLAYTDTFTLVSVKGGKQYTAQVSRDDSGGGSITITDTRPSGDPNGVTVRVPARRDNDFATKAESLFKYWPEGTVLVDGEAPEPLEGISVGDGFIVTDWSRSMYDPYGNRRLRQESRLTVVMGGVPYPAPDDYDHPAIRSLSAQKALTAYVPIGTVTFAPSRESLLDGPGTRKALDRLLDRFQQCVRDEITTQVEGATTPAAAAERLVNLRDVMGEKNLTGVEWRGKEIPLTLDLGVKYNYWHSEHKSGYYRRSVNERYRVQSLSIDSALHAVWILGFTNETWTKQMREKFNLYLTRNNLSKDAASENVVMTNATTLPFPVWLGSVRTVKWETIRKWKDPNAPKPVRGSGGNGSRVGTYPTYLPGGGEYREEYPAADIDPEAHPVYFTENGKYAYGRARYTDTLPDGYIVGLNRSRVAKFKRLFPTAKRLDSAAAEVANEWWDGLSPDDRAALTVPCEHPTVWLHLETANDPDLKRYARLLRKSETDALTDQWEKYRDCLITPDPDKSTSDLVARLKKRYPLLTHLRYGSPSGRDLLLYANAAYADTQTNTNAKASNNAK